MGHVQPLQGRRHGSTMPGSAMNVRRVIIVMTIAVFFVLTVMAVLFFHGIPPWPVLACFAISHGTFCLIVARVKPYKGPYKKPDADPELPRWPSQ